MKKQLPTHFYLGLFVMACAWVISWTKLTPFSYFTFILLWGGLIFVLDGLNLRLAGTSLYTRSRKWFWLLFLISVVFWWYFELVVMVVKNWYYFTDRTFISIFEHQLLGSIYFSTVIPAVLEMAELIHNLRIFPSRTHSLKLPVLKPGFFVVLGIAALILPVFLPQFFFPLVWLALFFLFDAYNYRTGAASLLRDWQRGQWGRTVKLAAAALLCGFLWEMWNYYADPKWFYDVPFVGVLKVFEMPVLGFFGYLPFGLEIFAVYVFMRNLLKKTPAKYFVLEDELHNRLRKLKTNVLVVMAFCVVLFLVPITMVEHRLQQDFYTLPLTTPSVMDVSIDALTWRGGVVGKVNLCILGIVFNHCLVTAHNEAFVLLTHDGTPLRTEVGKIVWVAGNIDYKLNEEGLGEVRVSRIMEFR